MNRLFDITKTARAVSEAMIAVSSTALTAAVITAGSSQVLAADKNHVLVSTIAFTSTRDVPNPASPGEQFNAAEIYLIDPDGSNPRRLTYNLDGDGFPVLSPGGKELVFDSNRERVEGEALNTSDLFVMDLGSGAELKLARGSSATWSADGKDVAYHASASGTGVPLRTDPGSATVDSDIFVLNVDDSLLGLAQPVNLTNSDTEVDDDPDWSPVLGVNELGEPVERIVFTSHPMTDDALNPNNSVHAEIYVMDTDGTNRVRLTDNLEEERGPAWSPDGTRIVYSARKNGPDFEVCVMNADGTNVVQLTNNTVGDLTPTWSPDGTQIVFHRLVAGRFQLFVMNADGTNLHQITSSAGGNLLANWGVLRARVKNEE